MMAPNSPMRVRQEQLYMQTVWEMVMLRLVMVQLGQMVSYPQKLVQSQVGIDCTAVWRQDMPQPDEAGRAALPQRRQSLESRKLSQTEVQSLITFMRLFFCYRRVSVQVRVEEVSSTRKMMKNSVMRQITKCRGFTLFFGSDSDPVKSRSPARFLRSRARFIPTYSCTSPMLLICDLRFPSFLKFPSLPLSIPASSSTSEVISKRSNPNTISLLTELFLDPPRLGQMAFSLYSSTLFLSTSLLSPQFLMMLLMYPSDLISLITISESMEAKRSKIFSCIGSRDRRKQDMGMTRRAMRTPMAMARDRWTLMEERTEESIIELREVAFCRLITVAEYVIGSRRLVLQIPLAMMLKSERQFISSDQKVMFCSCEAVEDGTTLRLAIGSEVLKRKLNWSSSTCEGKRRQEQKYPSNCTNFNLKMVSMDLMQVGFELFWLKYTVISVLLSLLLARYSCVSQRLSRMLAVRCCSFMQFMVSLMGLPTLEVGSQSRLENSQLTTLATRQQVMTNKKPRMTLLQRGTEFFQEKVERMLMAELLFLELEEDSESWLIAFSMFRISFTSLEWAVVCCPRLRVVDSLSISTWRGGSSGGAKFQARGELMAMQKFIALIITLNRSSLITPSLLHRSPTMAKYFLNSLWSNTSSLNPSSRSKCSPSKPTSAVNTRSLAFLTTEMKEVPSSMSTIILMLMHAITSSFLPTFIGSLTALCSYFDDTTSPISSAQKFRILASCCLCTALYPSGTSWFSSSPSSSSLGILTILQKLLLALSMISLNTVTPSFLPSSDKHFSSSEASLIQYSPSRLITVLMAQVSEELFSCI